MGDHILVAYVADHQFGVVRKVVGSLTIAVNLLDQAVEHPDTIAAPKKLTRNCAANKPRAACD